jgi:hypothetical protein
MPWLRPSRSVRILAKDYCAISLVQHFVCQWSYQSNGTRFWFCKAFRLVGSLKDRGAEADSCDEAALAALFTICGYLTISGSMPVSIHALGPSPTRAMARVCMSGQDRTSGALGAPPPPMEHVRYEQEGTIARAKVQAALLLAVYPLPSQPNPCIVSGRCVCRERLA